MKYATIAFDQEKQEVTITFGQNLEPFLVLFPDSKYLIDNCKRQHEETIIVSEEGFEDYLFFHRTVPLLLTPDIVKMLPRLEYAFHRALEVLMTALAEDCERIEQLPPEEAEKAFIQLTEKAQQLLANLYRNELAKLVALDALKYEKEHEGGFYQEDYQGHGVR